MIITRENYFSPEANKEYFSVSQYKTFAECSARAMAELNGEVEREKSVSMMVGSYVDAHFSKSLDLFKAQNPEIFLKGKSELKSEFRHAEYIIARIERDEMMMKYLSGETQVVITGEIEGVPFKTLIDSYHEGKAIVDQKIMRDMQPIWKDGVKLSFIEAWGHDLQMSIYQKIEGHELPVFLAVATKESEPDIAIISIPQERLDWCLDQVKQNIRHFNAIKKGLEEPTRCGKCDYCKSTKVLTEIKDYSEFA